eukprot:jgi/Tetstr1/456336/TSEL_043072.t1
MAWAPGNGRAQAGGSGRSASKHGDGKPSAAVDEKHGTMETAGTLEFQALARELDGAEAGEGVAYQEGLDGDDSERRSFWDEVRLEAQALMHDQLEEAKEAARAAGVEAAHAETEQLQRELADSEAEVQDLRDELEANQRELAEARSATVGSRQSELRDRTAEQRELAALHSSREVAQAAASKLTEEVRRLQSALAETRKELEEFRRRALHAEGIVDDCKYNQRLEAEARSAAEEETERMKEERKIALKAAKSADARREEAEEAARGAGRKVEVMEANGAYVRGENARLKGEVKELRARLEQLAREQVKQEEHYGRRSVTSRPGARSHSSLAPANSAMPTPGNSGGSTGMAMEQQRLGALLEQSISLWNDMHAAADALEEAERAASFGRPRPATVDRVLKSISQWADPPRVPSVAASFQSGGPLPHPQEVQGMLPPIRPASGSSPFSQPVKQSSNGASAASARSAGSASPSRGTTGTSRPRGSPRKGSGDGNKPRTGRPMAASHKADRMKRVYSLQETYTTSTIGALAPELPSNETFGLSKLFGGASGRKLSR